MQRLGREVALWLKQPWKSLPAPETLFGLARCTYRSLFDVWETEPQTARPHIDPLPVGVALFSTG